MNDKRHSRDDITSRQPFLMQAIYLQYITSSSSSSSRMGPLRAGSAGLIVRGRAGETCPQFLQQNRAPCLTLQRVRVEKHGSSLPPFLPTSGREGRRRRGGAAGKTERGLIAPMEKRLGDREDNELSVGPSSLASAWRKGLCAGQEQRTK
ncbi:hypothetical protein SKAU_G00147590 [Synaphobranchus kaupii]|uniref:Uncharacterized protein n=1 Tax=Synaphobranchus kaupii TaxID=118154 RepID=A0A9Q1J4W8_SYNKA|nr:hypothetical protein SKAU_G00147590 [Synaphobranchus kaupii]